MSSRGWVGGWVECTTTCGLLGVQALGEENGGWEEAEVEVPRGVGGWVDGLWCGGWAA